MQTKTNERLNTLLDTLTNAANTASEQAPLVYEEVVRWGQISRGIGVLVGLVFVACAMLALKRWKKKERDFEWFVVGAASGTIGFIVVACAGTELAKATFVPRVYVLDEVARLVK